MQGPWGPFWLGPPKSLRNVQMPKLLHINGATVAQGLERSSSNQKVGGPSPHAEVSPPHIEKVLHIDALYECVCE